MRNSIIYQVLLAAFLMTVTAASTCGQQVTRSHQVPGLRPYKTDLPVMTRAEKDSVRMVADLWKKYVESFTSASTTKSLSRSMWMNGMEDNLLEFDDGNMLYASFRENRVIDIRKIGGGTYELIGMTRSRLPGDDYEDWVECIYHVCAMAVADAGDQENPFRLCNWLDAEIPTLSKIGSTSIEYYLAPGLRFPRRAIPPVKEFIEKFTAEYGILPGGPVRYVVAPSADQCERMAGYLFNAYSNPLMSSVAPKANGYGFFSRVMTGNTLISNYFDDYHGIALLLLKNNGFADSLPMLVEGVATFHGGYMDMSYDLLKSSLKMYISGNNDIDLSNEDNLYDVSIPVRKAGKPAPVAVPLETAIGAVLVEYAYTRGGPDLVKTLLGCGGYEKIFAALGIPAKDCNDFIKGIL